MNRWLKAIPGVFLVLGAMGAGSARASLTHYYTASVNDGLDAYNLSDLTGTATFTADNTLGILRIVVNNTASIDAGIAAIFFNYDGGGAVLSSSVTVVSPLGSTASGALDKNADGFGDYDYKLSFKQGGSDYLEQGQSIEVTIAYTGTISDLNLQATSSGGNPGSPFVGAIDWKPNVEGNNGRVETGFGSAGVTVTGAPEPSTLALALSGFAAIGLKALRRRCRGGDATTC